MKNYEIVLAIARELGIRKPVPNFTKDLNAMHEAEESLTLHESDRSCA